MKKIGHNLRMRPVPQPWQCKAAASGAVQGDLRCHSLKRQWGAFSMLFKAVLNHNAPVGIKSLDQPARWPLPFCTPLENYLFAKTLLMSNRLKEAHRTESLWIVGRERKQAKQWNKNKSPMHLICWRNNVFSKLCADLFPFSYSLLIFFFFFWKLQKMSIRDKKVLRPAGIQKL